jgi:prepilin-type N-terminal cleavage/methylation domain-containing protein
MRLTLKKFPQSLRLAERGFSMLELMLVIAIMTVVFGIVATGMVQLQKRASTEANRVDRVQESRAFMEQVVRDIHQAGFPTIRMVANPAGNPNSYANALISVNRGDLVLEGDVDGSGQVSRIEVQLLDSNNVPCPSGACACTNVAPCTLQRGSITKANFAAGNPVYYYTQVTNITNSNIFTAYLYDGTPVALPASATDLPNIRNVGLTLSVQTASDMTDKAPVTITMSTNGKMNNVYP